MVNGSGSRYYDLVKEQFEFARDQIEQKKLVDGDGSQGMNLTEPFWVTCVDAMLKIGGFVAFFFGV